MAVLRDIWQPTLNMQVAPPELYAAAK